MWLSGLKCSLTLATIGSLPLQPLLQANKIRRRHTPGAWRLSVEPTPVIEDAVMPGATALILMFFSLKGVRGPYHAVYSRFCIAVRTAIRSISGFGRYKDDITPALLVFQILWLNACVREERPFEICFQLSAKDSGVTSKMSAREARYPHCLPDSQCRRESLQHLEWNFGRFCVADVI